MRILLFFILSIFVSVSLNGQNHYVVEDSPFGCPMGTAVKAGIESKVLELIDVLPVAHQAEFSVHDITYYTFHGIIPDAYSQAVDVYISNSVETDYYFLFAKILGPDGNVHQVRYFHNFPEDEYFECVDLSSLDVLMSKIVSGTLSFFPYNCSSSNPFQPVVLDILKEYFLKLNNCCAESLLSAEECSVSPYNGGDILPILYAKGFVAYPIEITDSIPPVSFNSTTRALRSATIVNSNKYVFDLYGEECDIADNIAAFFSPDMQVYNSKIYIVDNSLADDPIQWVSCFQDVEFVDYDMSAVFFVYKSANADIPDLLLYQDYSGFEVAWYGDSLSYDEEKHYAPFQFAGTTGFDYSKLDMIPEKPGLWRWLSNASSQKGHMTSADAFAHWFAIPSENIEFHQIHEQFIANEIDFLFQQTLGELYVDFNTLAFAVIHDPGAYDIAEVEPFVEHLHFFHGPHPLSWLYSIDWIKEIPRYFDEGLYGDEPFNTKSTVFAPWHFWDHNDDESIMDSDWYRRFKDADFLGKDVVKGSVKKTRKGNNRKALVKTVNRHTLYKLVVNQVAPPGGELVYYGRTLQELKKRIGQHSNKLSKLGKTVEKHQDLLKERVPLNTVRGLEQLAIEGARMRGDNLLNAINSISPTKNGGTKFAEYIREAVNYARKNAPNYADDVDLESTFYYIKKQYPNLSW